MLLHRSHTVANLMEGKIPSRMQITKEPEQLPQTVSFSAQVVEYLTKKGRAPSNKRENTFHVPLTKEQTPGQLRKILQKNKSEGALLRAIDADYSSIQRKPNHLNFKSNVKDLRIPTISKTEQVQTWRGQRPTTDLGSVASIRSTVSNVDNISLLKYMEELEQKKATKLKVNEQFRILHMPLGTTIDGQVSLPPIEQRQKLAEDQVQIMMREAAPIANKDDISSGDEAPVGQSDSESEKFHKSTMYFMRKSSSNFGEKMPRKNVVGDAARVKNQQTQHQWTKHEINKIKDAKGLSQRNMLKEIMSSKKDESRQVQQPQGGSAVKGERQVRTDIETVSMTEIMGLEMMAANRQMMLNKLQRKANELDQPLPTLTGGLKKAIKNTTDSRIEHQTQQRILEYAREHCHGNKASMFQDQLIKTYEKINKIQSKNVMELSVQHNEELQSKLKNMNENIFDHLNRHDFNKAHQQNTRQIKEMFKNKIGVRQSSCEKRKTSMQPNHAKEDYLVLPAQSQRRLGLDFQLDKEGKRKAFVDQYVQKFTNK